MVTLKQNAEILVNANGYLFWGCFEYEFVKVLRSDNLFGTLTQTSKDSPNAICPFGNTISCPSEDIGSALCYTSFGYLLSAT